MSISPDQEMPEFSLNALQQHRCVHAETITRVQPERLESCPECVLLGDTWVQLRVCMTCGHVGCCDSSKNKHATQHFHVCQHPIIRSLEPGETWAYCYVDRWLVGGKQVTVVFQPE